MNESDSLEVVSEECEKCRADIAAFSGYGIETFSKEYPVAYEHMFGDRYGTCGKTDRCWKCLVCLDARLSELL